MFANAQLYGRTYEEAVKNNEQEIAEIERFISELNGVRENLELNKKHLFQRIMLPLNGGKALIKAKLVHTNEIMVYLGDKWFVHTSADRALDICERKIERCNKNIAQIKQETARFTSNVEKSQEFELFPCGEFQEIIEPYDEEKEKLWREEHKRKVREYKQAEAAARKMSDAELAKRLEELEKEEEVRNELDTSKQLPETVDAEEKEIDEFVTKNPKKRVSFSDLDTKLYSPAETFHEEDINVIRFAHSSNEPRSSKCEHVSELISPADIYRLHVQNLHPKSILKRDENFESVEPKSTTYYQEPSSRNMTIAREDISDEVFGDIVEKTFDDRPMEKPARTMSKFRKSRVEMSHR